MLTVLLFLTGIGGTWVAAKHWWGWLICAGSEFLWMTLALQSHVWQLFAFSWFWLAVNLRNAKVTR